MINNIILYMRIVYNCFNKNNPKTTMKSRHFYFSFMDNILYSSPNSLVSSDEETSNPAVVNISFSAYSFVRFPLCIVTRDVRLFLYIE